MAAPLREMKEQHIPDTLRANHAYETKSKLELKLFYHAACFSPTKRTFVDAIKRNVFAYLLTSSTVSPGQDAKAFLLIASTKVRLVGLKHVA